MTRPNFGANGEFQGMIGVNVDVTEREEADEHKRLLINELNHRVKNTLAVVQAMARQTFRTDAPRALQQEVFEGRLAALAQAHNLLAAESWQSASLEEVARNSVNGGRRYAGAVARSACEARAQAGRDHSHGAA